jgi:hypothetical protein
VKALGVLLSVLLVVELGIKINRDGASALC